MPTMLYKYPGSTPLAGLGSFDWLIVEDSAIDAAIADGWALTMESAMTAEKDDAPPTRAELEAKATELGIKFDGRTGDAALARKILDALKG